MPWIQTFFTAILSAPFLFFSAFGGPHLPPPTQAQQPGSSSQPVACTMEAKLCPDGSYVGRIPPLCNFAACPGATSTTPAEPTPAAPTISSITPTRGAVGTQVTIAGNGFTNDNKIHFGLGVIAPVAAKPAVYHCPMQPAGSHNSCGNATQILTFTIPDSVGPYCPPEAKACPLYIQKVKPGTYKVSVENENGTSNTTQFTVTEAESTHTPDIYSITPQQGSIGSTVTIGGDGFTDDNIIHFGSGAIAHVAAKPAVFNCPMMPAGDTKACGPFTQTLTFTVPNSVRPYCPAGQMCPLFIQKVTPGTYNISVQNENGTSNAKSFTVTN